VAGLGPPTPKAPTQSTSWRQSVCKACWRGWHKGCEGSAGNEVWRYRDNGAQTRCSPRYVLLAIVHLGLRPQSSSLPLSPRISPKTFTATLLVWFIGLQQWKFRQGFVPGCRIHDRQLEDFWQLWLLPSLPLSSLIHCHCHLDRKFVTTTVGGGGPDVAGVVEEMKRKRQERVV